MFATQILQLLPSVIKPEAYSGYAHLAVPTPMVDFFRWKKWWSEIMKRVDSYRSEQMLVVEFQVSAPFFGWGGN